MFGLRAHERAKKLTNFYVKYKIRPLVLKLGKLYCALPPNNNFDGLPRAREGTDRARTSTDVSGRASRVDYTAVYRKVLVLV